MSKAKVFCKKLDPVTQKEEWKVLRESGIGGSDVGTICGVNPYSAGLEVFYDKLGELNPKDDNEVMEWGRTLEPIIADKFASQTIWSLLPDEVMANCDKDIIVLQPNFTVINPDCVYSSSEYPFMFANPDRIIDHPAMGKGILEIKTSNEYNYSDWMDGNIPLSYIFQVQHYLYVMDYQYAFIAALIGGNKFRTFFMMRDENIIQPMLKQEIDFWTRLTKYRELKIEVLNSFSDAEQQEYLKQMEEIKPQLRFGENATRLLKGMYAEAEKGTLTDLPDYKSDADQWFHWKSVESEAKKQKDFYAQKIQAAMGTNEKVAIGTFTAEWPTRSRAGYTVDPCTYRQFTIKEPKIKNIREGK
jgi:predicted phage-related endonuclease